MAFVYRSSKNLEEKIKPNNNPNFYEGINLLTEIYKKYSQKTSTNKSPFSFGSKALRKSLNFKDGSDSPGPGSYKLQKSFLKNSFIKNLTSPNDPEGLEGEPAQLFISKDKRFKEFNKSNKDNPSPFEYFKQKNNFEPNNKYNKDLSRLKTFGNYSPFSPKRQISIPTNDLYYKIKNDGEIEVKTDLEEMKNLKNKLGPGKYNIRFYNKKNNSIDWSKTVKEIKVDENRNKENKDKKNIKNIQINTDNSFNNSTIPNDTILHDRTYNSTNMITHNIERLADQICNVEIGNERKKNKSKEIFNLKIDDVPGPGDYDTTFNIDAPIKFSNVNNFGSNVSRGLLFPISINKIKIGTKNKKSSIIIRNENNKEKINNNIKSLTLNNKDEKENNQLIKNNNSYKLHTLHVNDIKEKYIKNKKLLNSNLGPGSYNPSLSYDKNKKENYIQNFNSLEARFLMNNKDTFMFPGVGTYSTIDSYAPKKTYFKSLVPPNITLRHLNGISASKIQETKEKLYYNKHRQPCVGEYYPEINDSIEYNNFKITENYNNGKKPCFNYAEKRFFEPKRKYEDENQVGKYNITFKEKEIKQKMTPFSSNVERNGVENFIPKDKDKKQTGPGAYRYDSYFDWNKKSYNILFA